MSDWFPLFFFCISMYSVIWVLDFTSSSGRGSLIHALGVCSYCVLARHSSSRHVSSFSFYEWGDTLPQRNIFPAAWAMPGRRTPIAQLEYSSFWVVLADQYTYFLSISVDNSWVPQYGDTILILLMFLICLPAPLFLSLFSQALKNDSHQFSV